MIKVLIAVLILFPFMTWGQQNNTIRHVSSSEYDSLLHVYKEGRLPYHIYPGLIRKAHQLGDKKIGGTIAENYVNNYLLRLPEDSFFIKKVLEDIREFNISTDNKLFRLFYGHPARIDQIVGRLGFADDYIDELVEKEEIDKKIWISGKSFSGSPDWKKIKQTISKKYNREIADRTVLERQIQWSQFKSDSLELSALFMNKIRRYGWDTTGFGKANLNNIIYYYVFLHDNDKRNLNEAIGWMEMLLKSEPENPWFIDTYANLLYKIGRKREALRWEERSLALDPDNKETLYAWSKMNKNEPTWRVK